MMLSSIWLRRSAVAALVAIACGHGSAQTVTYTFSELPVNREVTTQYAGVTFSLSGNSCPQPLYMRTASHFLGTHPFVDPVLVIDQGCPDFSVEYLIMEFDEPTKEVSFSLGPWAGSYQVRAYNSLGSLVSTQNITIPGTGFKGVNEPVSFGATFPAFKRIEVQETGNLFEAIDDLTFEFDDTPPVVEITFPTTMECFCGGAIFGAAHDPDGVFGQWKLEYATNPGGPWSSIAVGSSAHPGGALASWDTTGRPEGYHYLRLTAQNAVRLESSTTVAVWVSRDFDVVDLNLPAVVGRDAHPWGTSQDNFCAEEYTVEVRQLPGGAFLPVDPGTPVYPGSRVNQTFAIWDTANAPDGPYEVRVTGVNSCGQASAERRTVIVDNTPPLAELGLPPESCQRMPPGVYPIIGTAADEHLAGWTLQFTGGPFHEWITIAQGNAPRFNQVLAEWDTRQLPPCDYTLRLVVTDEAVLDGNSALHHRSTYLTSVRLGCEADFDLNGIQDVLDLLSFLEFWFGTCP